MLTLWKKSYDQPSQHIKKQKLLFSNKVHVLKAMVFLVVMYGCESWSIKKAECWRIDAFKLRCWRRLFRVPWTARSSNQSILKEISPEYSLEGLMLKLKLQYFGPWCEELTHLKIPWCWERAEGDNREWDGWMASLTQWTWVWVNSGSWLWTGGLVCCHPLCQKESDMTDWLNWTELTWYMYLRSLDIPVKNPSIRKLPRWLNCEGNIDLNSALTPTSKKKCH